MMRYTSPVALIIFVLVFSLANHISARTIFVNSARTGTSTGSGQSWTNAFLDLQVAITVAQPGDDIWVAAGTYKPTTAVDRGISFDLKPGVSIFGGFSGEEDVLSQRDWEVNKTILSGDIGIVKDNRDNSFNVVVGADNAVLDGFIVTGGNAGIEGGTPEGGGMRNVNSSPTVANCTFTNNIATGPGGGIFNDDASPTITNCLFSDNLSQRRGGGIYNRNASPIVNECIFRQNVSERGGAVANISLSAPSLTNCLFEDNHASENGGALYNSGRLGATARPRIINCVFFGNEAVDNGGAVYNISFSAPRLINCTLTNNSALTKRGGAVFNNNHSNLEIRNTIIVDNFAAAKGSEQIFNDFTANIDFVTVKNSNIAGSGGSGENWDGVLGVDDGGNIDDDPMFIDPEDPDGPDGVFATHDDGLRLRVVSSKNFSSNIDAGVTEGISETDVLGNPRVKNTGVDLGAYEHESGTVTGRISYAGQQTGAIILQVYTESSLTDIAPSQFKFTEIGSYTINGLPIDDFYLRAFVDENNNDRLDETEDRGTYPSIPVSLITDRADVNIAIHAISSDPGTLTIDLHEGWNLISIPVFPDSSHIDTIFGNTILGKIWFWNGNTLQNATILEPNLGYWVYCNAPDHQITISGHAVAETDLEPQSTWSLIGVAKDGTVPPPNVATWNWDGRQFNKSESLDRGKGYWIFNPN